jgi:hypothetical protein
MLGLTMPGLDIPGARYLHPLNFAE